MRRFATAYILAFTIFIGEIHTFWDKQDPPVIENWIWKRYRPMSISWNVKYATDQLNAILYFVAMFYYRPNRVNRASVQTLIIFAILDTCLYFYNYKTYDYGKVYFWLVGIWIFLYFWRPATKWVWRHIYPIST